MSWNTLLEIIKENRRIAEEENAKGTTSCPVCDYGWLERNEKTGQLGCEMCGWVGW